MLSKSLWFGFFGTYWSRLMISAVYIIFSPTAMPRLVRYAFLSANKAQKTNSIDNKVCDIVAMCGKTPLPAHVIDVNLTTILYPQVERIHMCLPHALPVLRLFCCCWKAVQQNYSQHIWLLLFSKPPLPPPPPYQKSTGYWLTQTMYVLLMYQNCYKQTTCKT